MCVSHFYRPKQQLLAIRWQKVFHMRCTRLIQCTLTCNFDCELMNELVCSRCQTIAMVLAHSFFFFHFLLSLSPSFFLLFLLIIIYFIRQLRVLILSLAQLVGLCVCLHVYAYVRLCMCKYFYVGI